MKKLFLWLPLFLLICYGANRLYFHLTDGFCISKITPTFILDEAWTFQTSEGEKREAKKILEQPFTYLAKGRQSYVFCSQDGNYVIKFPKFQKYRIPPFYSKEKTAKRTYKLTYFLSSWKTAFKDLRQECCLLYVQTNPDPAFHHSLTLIDKVGRAHTIDLSKFTFMVQRKGELLPSVIETRMAKGEVAAAESLLNKLLELYISEYARGIAEKDTYIQRNTAVIEGMPFHVDPARFVKEEAFKQPERMVDELRQKTVSLRVWLSENYPQLARFFENQIPRSVFSLKTRLSVMDSRLRELLQCVGMEPCGKNVAEVNEWAQKNLLRRGGEVGSSVRAL